MKANRVIPSGFCKGVVNAIRLAKETKLNNQNENVYVLGMLVHNHFVSDELSQMGIITLDDTKKSKEELIDEIDDGIVIFTAHGISRHIKQKVIDKGLKYVDATCVDVLKTQNIILDYLNKGYDVLYFGKNNHPEAQAVLSLSNNIHLITCEKDIEELNIDNPKLFLTNQTTMSYLELNDLKQLIINKYPNIVIEEEICNATSSRQMAIYKLMDCDLLYVVGDKKSNNSNMLVEIALKHGIKKAFLIQSFEDINDDDLIGVDNVYVTAGASTPPKQIDDVINYLSSKSSD